MPPDRRLALSRQIKNLDVIALHLKHRRPIKLHKLFDRSAAMYMFEHTGEEISVEVRDTARSVPSLLMILIRSTNRHTSSADTAKRLRTQDSRVLI